jgi:hypothetical protein
VIARWEQVPYDTIGIVSETVANTATPNGSRAMLAFGLQVPLHALLEAVNRIVIANGNIPVECREATLDITLPIWDSALLP